MTGKVKCSLREYHAHQAVGSTLLRTLISRTPAHYLYDLEHPTPSTPLQEFRSAIHQAVLEPRIFKDQMVVKPVFEGYTKDKKLTTNENCLEVKEKSERWHMENHGKTILKIEQYDTIKGILSNISKHKRASSLISDGHPEESFFWTDPETGIEMKTRPDFIRDGHICVDLKTTLNAKYSEFQKDIANHLYHVQAAIQLDGISEVLGQKYNDHVILAVEVDPPFEINCLHLDEQMINEGRALYQMALKTLKECRKTGIYPGYGDQLTPISLPSWAVKGDL